MRSLRSVPAAVGRRLRKAVGTLRPTPAPEDRLLAALSVVAAAESLEPSLRSSREPVELWGRERVARTPELDPLLTALVPHDLRTGWSPRAEDVRVLEAPVAADLVVTAKFDINAQIKLRAAYAQGRRTLAVQPPGRNGLDGIGRAVEAHQIVSRHAPGLVPPLLGHGLLRRGLPYLVETWLEGEPLVTGRRLAEAAPEILAGLAAVHRGHGIEPARLSVVWDRLAMRWPEVVALGLVPEDLAAWVEGLIARDGTLRRSWGHGDLVASNVLRTADGIVLIDWEYARVAPIMSDGAKLHLFSADPAGTLAQLLHHHGTSPSGNGPVRDRLAYSPAEELALAHAAMLSRYPLRRAALEGHPRAAVYEKQVRRVVERLGQVHDAA